jgi:hypothetical protein
VYWRGQHQAGACFAAMRIRDAPILGFLLYQRMVFLFISLISIVMIFGFRLARLLHIALHNGQSMTRAP